MLWSISNFDSVYMNSHDLLTHDQDSFYYLLLLSFCHFQHTCRCCYDSFCTLADSCSTQFSRCTHLKACIWKYLQSVSVYTLLLHFMPYLGSWQEMREGESEVHRLT